MYSSGKYSGVACASAAAKRIAALTATIPPRISRAGTAAACASETGPGAASERVAAASTATSPVSAGGLGRLERPQREPVAERLHVRPRRPLQEPEAAEEARPPLVAVDLQPGRLQVAPQLVPVAEADVGRVLREDEVARLEPLDHVFRVRCVQREGAAGPQHAPQLAEHPVERRIVEVLDEVRCDRL